MQTKFLISIFSLLIFSACSMTEKKEATDNQTNKTNIIYILADDLGYGDLSTNGQKKFSTPYIDKMAREGMKFLRHYSGSTVCAPSRSSLMTGLHTGHTYIRGNKEVKPEGQAPIPASIELLPEMMMKAGFVTGGFGKWGLGGPGSEGDPVNQGIQHFYGYNCQRLAHNYYPEYLWNNTDKLLLSGNDQRGTEEYGPDLIHQEALSFIESHQDTQFFLYLPYVIPHAELLVPDDSLFQKYKGQFEETPYQGVDEGETYRKGPYGSQEYPHAAFAAMVRRLDIYVGEILQKLQETGLDENTLVIFTSDNGPHKEGGADPAFFNSGAGMRGVKRDLYEGGIRVPMIAWWPGTIQAGSSTDHISAFWDVLPTVCELSSIPIPDNVDGISFLPTLLGKAQASHSYLYWEFHEQGGKQAILEGDWKAIKLNVNKKQDPPIALYDLESDPTESTDVSAQHPELIRKMDSLMTVSHIPSSLFPFGEERMRP